MVDSPVGTAGRCESCAHDPGAGARRRAPTEARPCCAPARGRARPRGNQGRARRGYRSADAAHRRGSRRGPCFRLAQPNSRRRRRGRARRPVRRSRGSRSVRRGRGIAPAPGRPTRRWMRFPSGSDAFSSSASGSKASRGHSRRSATSSISLGSACGSSRARRSRVSPHSESCRRSQPPKPRLAHSRGRGCPPSFRPYRHLRTRWTVSGQGHALSRDGGHLLKRRLSQADSRIVDAAERNEILSRYADHARRFEAAAARRSSRSAEIIPFTAPLRELEQEPTPREVQVLQFISEGLVNREIGKVLFLSEETVKSHVRHLLAKLQARSRAHAVAIGFRRGILS